MKTSYSLFSGLSVERLAALSDGIFAVAMTLLVLELKVPAAQAIHSERELGEALRGLIPGLITFALSFLTLGIFWNGQQAQLGRLQRSDRHLTWLHLAFLFPVSLLPFSTSLLTLFLTYRTALLLYWLNILVAGILLHAAWAYAMRHGLIRESTTAGEDAAIRRRILVAQLLYAVGAALCFWSPYASLFVFFAVQVNFAVGPRSGWLSRV